MRQIKSKGMKPELLVRKLVHSMGYRYRLHRKGLPGKPDLVFPGRKKVIFVNGCFWHQHEDSTCKIVRQPKSNLEYWAPKLEKNKQRDLKNKDLLETAGWEIFVIWECQTKEKGTLTKVINDFLG